MASHSGCICIEYSALKVIMNNASRTIFSAHVVLLVYQILFLVFFFFSTRHSFSTFWWKLAPTNLAASSRLVLAFAASTSDSLYRRSKMREVVTLQFGQQSNHVGTHFWNAQVSSSFLNIPNLPNAKAPGPRAEKIIYRKIDSMQRVMLHKSKDAKLPADRPGSP